MENENENEHFINPDSWTEKELLKHLYREVKEIKGSLINIDSSIRDLELKSESIEKRVAEERTIRKTKEEDIHKRMTLNNTVAAIVGVIIAALALWASFGA